MADEPKESDDKEANKEVEQAPQKPLIQKLLAPLLWLKSVLVITLDDFKANFRPRVVPSIMALVMFLILLGLGQWQLNRLEWKLGLISDIETRQTSESVQVHRLPHDDHLSWDSLNYRRAIVSGQLQILKSFKVTPRVHNGNVGFHVLTPMRLGNGLILLVNRGWAPDNHKMINAHRQNEAVAIQGTLFIPSQEKGYFMPENNPKTKAWHWYDLPAMAKALGYTDIAPAVLFVDESFALRGEEDYPIGGQLSLEQRNWHLWYAITWYTLAGILFIIWVAFSWQHAHGTPQTTDNESSKDDENLDSVKAKESEATDEGKTEPESNEDNKKPDDMPEKNKS